MMTKEKGNGQGGNTLHHFKKKVALPRCSLLVSVPKLQRRRPCCRREVHVLLPHTKHNDTSQLVRVQANMSYYQCHAKTFKPTTKRKYQTRYQDIEVRYPISFAKLLLMDTKFGRQNVSLQTSKFVLQSC